MASTIPRIALVGPVQPFRGGISQHTTMLRRALSEQCLVRTYSFSRQYPSWIFPGESDRDAALDGYVEPDTVYSLDSMNPWTWRCTVDELFAWHPDAAIFPWWTVYFAPMFAYMARRLRSAGVEVHFICHNVVEHETAAWRRFVTRRVLAIGSSYTVHTRIDERNLLSMFPDATHVLHPLPVFDNYPPAHGSLVREHELELLFFGFVRPYKGLDVLIEALALVDPGLDVRLAIVGEFWHGAEESRSRIERLGLEGRIDIVERYVSDAEAAEYFDRADAVVLPYRAATGSGVVAVAYHYDTPVISTEVGGLPDVIVDGETGLVVEPESPIALARAIERLAVADRSLMRSAIQRFKAERLSWPGFASAVLAVATDGTVPSRDRRA